MKRSILVSLLVIGAAAAFMVGGGTLAPFGDSQTITGDVNAGTVDLYISDVTGADDTAGDEAIFNAAAENLLPGQSTSWTVRLLNNGANAWDWTTTDTSGSVGLDCDGGGNDFSIAVADLTDHGGDNHGGTVHVAPAGAEDVTVTVTLAAGATDACQGDIANVSVVIGVTGH
jgi:predicted ribosomally synthesized peptide with SipW-like signal peptide